MDLRDVTDLTLAARSFEVLLGLSLLLQTLEYWKVQQLDHVGSWAVQRAEVPAQPAWVRPLLDRLFEPTPYRLLLALRGALALGLVAGQVQLLGALLLFAIALVLLLRWRGAFNGGSDFMTLVGLSGLLMAQALGAWGDPVLGWRACLWYVTLHSVSSYFVSGWVKLLRPEWRSGRALTLFLDDGVYGPLPPGNIFLSPHVAQACAWAFTLWEGCFPLALLDVRLAALFCVLAAAFHFSVFWFFGLNRFFWAWLVTFPAVLYCAGQTGFRL